MASHATGRGSGQPTPAQFKELFAQVESGRVNKSRMQEFLRGPTQTVTVEVAQEIVGKKNFFGPKEWSMFFGKKFQLATIPEIPWSQSELENFEIDQKHFLFLGLSHLDGKPLNLSTWREIYPGGNHPKFDFDLDWWYPTHKFAQATCGLRWYLMPVGIVGDSESLLYNLQVRLLPDEYEVPTVSARVTANIQYYLLNGRYLDTVYCARTSDKSDDGCRIGVQCYSDNGIDVFTCDDDADDDEGVAASLKF